MSVGDTAVFGEEFTLGFVAVFTDFLERRHIVHQLAILEDIYHKFLQFILVEGGLFPSLFRVIDCEGF